MSLYMVHEKVSNVAIMDLYTVSGKSESTHSVCFRRWPEEPHLMSRPKPQTQQCPNKFQIGVFLADRI